MNENSLDTTQGSSVKGVQPARSIDTFAAQCENCKKWRVIPTQEEYEDIRSKIPENPFVCEKKSGVSCDDPADIEYDATRCWVIDKPGIPKTPGGFKRILVLRKDFSKMDAYYLSPTGKKLRSVNEIATFIEQHHEFKGIKLSHFSFTSPKVMEDTIPEYAILRTPPGGGNSSSAKKIKLTKN